MMGKLEQWLQDLDLVKYRDAFAENEITFEDLKYLTEDDLREMELPIGPRRRILRAIADTEAIDLPAEDSEVSGESKSGQAAERRQLTIMFCDLVGSTALSSNLDPEEMREVITTYQNIVAGAVTRFDGNVAKYMGDGVLCYFGWPRAHEDDAERALRAGLAIMEDLSSARTPHGEPLAARAGIATGLVVVGDLVGTAAAQEEAVIGETPNLAARLQGLAAPNTVAISDSTRRLLGQVFELQDLGPQTFRGIAEPIAVYSVLREAAIESRFEARRGDATLELVGRDEELALLLHRWQQACQGEGQAALISGEAGIGKSRLLRAFGDALKGKPHYRINYQCSPHHIDSPLYPVIQQLTRAAELEATDSDDVKLEKLEALIGLATGDLGKSAPFVAALLDIDSVPRYGELDLTPQRMRTETLQALKAQLLGLAQGQPVFLVLEDVHWADPTTLEFIDHSLEEVSQAEVMILMTARPSFAHRIVSHPSVTSLVLNRLSRKSCMGIIDALTAGKVLPDDVLDAIISKTDGVPLFVEEMTKTVLEMEPQQEGGHDEYVDHQLRPLAIPSTLQDSLMARLDRHSMAKDVAQIGRARRSSARVSMYAERSVARLAASIHRFTASAFIPASL